jgi:hypothetical protein
MIGQSLSNTNEKCYSTFSKKTHTKRGPRKQRFSYLFRESALVLSHKHSHIVSRNYETIEKIASTINYLLSFVLVILESLICVYRK